MPLINCEVFLTLFQSGNCVITSKAFREAVDGGNPVVEIDNPTGLIFKILYNI